jgi:Protein of unknown function (DUF1501)
MRRKTAAGALPGAGGRGSGRHGGLPADCPVHVSDFFATMYHSFGYGPETHVSDPSGRPHHVMQGKPVLDLF